MLFLHLASHSFVALILSLAWYATQTEMALITVPLSIATGIVLSHIIHEWGHFLGAVLAGSTYTLKKKISPLFFDFDYVKNTPRQYLWMSLGGPIGNILLITLITIGLSMQTLASHWLLATATGQLVYVIVLEGPVSLGILRGGNPLQVLSTHFGQGKPLFMRSLVAGVVSGLSVVWILGYI